ncbi:MAG: alpha/beta hydrolase [Synergistaceae bacterium]|nr:alpha/beta hydrolase [Synergistaceae bacterium]
MRFLYRPDGARIGWKRYGGDIGLLLIPGFGGDGSCWGGAFPRLLREQGIAPVIYDPRGLGESSGGSSVHSMPLYAEDAAAVAEAAGAPLAALGWSMGAGVAAELALARPDLVSALILCSGVPDHGSAARARPEIFGPLTGDSLSDAALTLAKALAPPGRGWSGPFTRSLGQNLLSFFLNHEKAIRGQQAVLRGMAPLADRLGELSIPVLVIEGEEDPLIPPGSGAALASEMEGAVCKTLPGGHGLVYERPKELADLVAAFIRASIPAGN